MSPHDTGARKQRELEEELQKEGRGEAGTELQVQDEAEVEMQAQNGTERPEQAAELQALRRRGRIRRVRPKTRKEYYQTHGRMVWTMSC